MTTTQTGPVPGHIELAFIGAGNMAMSLAGGLIGRGMESTRIIAADPVAAQRQRLAELHDVRTTADNELAAAKADVIVLAVKPQQLRGVAGGLAPIVSARRPTVISIAAGVRASDLARWLGGLPVIRCMPNSPALIGCGVTALYAMPGVEEGSRQLAADILAAVGATLWLEDESLMDAVTAVSGSGPAYFFLLIEMLETAGTELGLPRDISRRLALETAFGACRMARESALAPAMLRAQVTSRGGTTEAALTCLERAGLRAIFASAVTAAARRSAELADQLGGS